MVLRDNRINEVHGKFVILVIPFLEVACLPRRWSSHPVPHARNVILREIFASDSIKVEDHFKSTVSFDFSHNAMKDN